VESAVNELCRLEYEIKKGRLVLDNKGRRGAWGGKFRDVEFKLSVLLGSASLDFFVSYNDGEVARCKTNYIEDKDRFVGSAWSSEKNLVRISSASSVSSVSVISDSMFM
jgi:hypothetical protein